MTQKEALNILKTGANVFLTGEPGSGKTHTVNEYVAYLRAHKIEPAITASTGIAATHLGGMTIHSWSGIGVKDTLTEYDLDKISQNERIVKRINRAKVLIIDEVSMLSAATLDMVDAVCRAIKRPDKSFGGLQVILVGDFFQLPPIVRRNAEENMRLSFDKSGNAKTHFAYGADSWARLNPLICYLTEQHRQEDADFLGVLSAIRKAEINDGHRAHLTRREKRTLEGITDLTKLYTHNADVDRINDMELSKIPEELRTFTQTSRGAPYLVEQLKKSCLSPEKLHLKVGAKVMFTKNNSEAGYVNGTTGEVTGFDEYTDAPVVVTTSGEKITVDPAEWAVAEDGKELAKITQVPLRLAWAITVHKSQGMSLDAAVIDLSQAFEYGQGYVALSRVRSLSGLHILGMNDRALEVNKETLEEDERFREASEKARETFQNLDKDELKQLQENFIIATGGKVKPSKDDAPSASKIDELRKTYAHAYMPWSDEDDAALYEAYEGGAKISKLAKDFGRKPGAIKMRLVKLGLIEDDSSRFIS